MPVFEHENLSLFYRENGSGQLLLILPGNTSSSICHGGELDYFGQDYHALSLDFRGTGKSQRLASWPEDWWEKCADDAAALINHLGEQSCLVMGTSGGGNIALLLASSIRILSQASSQTAALRFFIQRICGGK